MVQKSSEGQFPSIRIPPIVGEKKKWQCAYRGDEGKRCPAGLLIDDTVYDVGIEGKTALHFKVENSINVPTGMTMKEVRAVQSVHDELFFGMFDEDGNIVEEWEHTEFVSGVEHALGI